MDGYNTYILRKLVRDASIKNMTDKGALVDYRVLEPIEKKRELVAKLTEEVAEVAAAEGDDLIEELADLMEIIYTLAAVEGADAATLEKMRAAKRDKRGDYSKSYYVESIACPIGSYWDAYCSKDPAKYPPLDTPPKAC